MMSWPPYGVAMTSLKTVSRGLPGPFSIANSRAADASWRLPSLRWIKVVGEHGQIESELVWPIIAFQRKFESKGLGFPAPC